MREETKRERGGGINKKILTIGEQTGGRVPGRDCREERKGENECDVLF